MSALDARGRRSISPPNSGRSSPVPRATRRMVEDGLYKADKSLKRYAAHIERALGSWEIAPEEWADYIAFLGRLLKAIQTHPKDPPILPHTSTIATRLAQCLNPALPSGVHQKSLEVYAYIFSTFGIDYVAAHLHEYLPGLAAVLSFASLSVRPGVYVLFEDYIVGLPVSELRPALKSLILALLPALEEEASEDFDRAFAILCHLESGFMPNLSSDDLAQETDGYFWQCVFLAVITSGNRRQGALNYLSRRLPKLAWPHETLDEANLKRPLLPREAECIVSPEPGLLVRCFVCGLSDAQVLVQRGFLDLLVTHLPLHSSILQKRIGDDELVRLISAATSVLLRRDMSLNRRLWTWFLGPEPKDPADRSQPSSPTAHRKTAGDGESKQLRYFTRYGNSSLQRCILDMLRASSLEPAGRAKPFRICLSLMDRWEIGGLLVPDVFMPAMASLYQYSLSAPRDAAEEVVRSASLFFDGVEAGLIWSCLLATLREGLEMSHNPRQSLDMFQWIIRTFNVKDEEMLTIHIPVTLLYLLTILNTNRNPEGTGTQILGVSHHLLDLMPTRLFQVNHNQSPQALNANGDILFVIQQLYHSDRGFVGRAHVPFELPNLTHFICSKTVSLLEKALADLDVEHFLQAAALLNSLLAKTNDKEMLEKTRLRDILTSTFVPHENTAELPFPIVNAAVSLVHTICPRDTTDKYLSTAELVAMEHCLTAQLWISMSPTNPKYNVEAVRAFWLLEQLLPDDDVVLATLAALVRDSKPKRASDSNHRTETVRRFTVLWGHSMPTENLKTGSIRRGSGLSTLADSKRSQRSLQVLKPALLLALDALSDPSDSAFDVVRSWLRTLPSLELILQSLLADLNMIVAHKSQDKSLGQHERERDEEVRNREMEYVLRHVQQMLVHGNEWTWHCLSRTFVLDVSSTDESEALILLTNVCVRLLCDEQRTSLALSRRVVAILELLLSGPASLELRYLELDTVLLDRLMACLNGEMALLQSGILRLIQLALKLRLVGQGADQPPDSAQRGSIGSKTPSIAPTSRPQSATASARVAPSPPAQLFRCLRVGFASPRARGYLDVWLEFLADILPTFADVIFANLLPLVTTLCEEVAKTHQEMVSLSRHKIVNEAVQPESVAIGLIEALQMVLDRAYECLHDEVSVEPAPQEPTEKTNFFSNVRSNVFKTDGPPTRTAKSNSRLTFILALQDALRVTLEAWLWSSTPTETRDFDHNSAATTAFHALKLRHRARQYLEHVFSLEPLESLEVVIAYWCNAAHEHEASSVLSVLHVLQMSRPKNVVPALLDALCSRLNPTSIPSTRHSTLTMDLRPSEIAVFFSTYLDSTEDDAMDEVWPDCIAFLRDVLLDPLRYGKILPHLLSIVLLLAQKLNNTNFGEQRKMRRDLGDIFQRLLNATLTALAPGYVAEAANLQHVGDDADVNRRSKLDNSMRLIPVLNRVVDQIDLILETSERSSAAINDITTRLIAPTVRAKSFPKNIEISLLDLLVRMTKKAPASKMWKKEVHDLLQESNTKFLASSPDMMRSGWFLVLHQWTLHERERVPDLLSRFTSPSSAGAVFGIGASTARLAEDRRTQYNLRRICLLLMASPEDTYVAHLRLMEEKTAELFEASPASSPSSNIKAELFMLCRTLALSVNDVHLSPLWPIINDKLHAALLSLLPNSKTRDEFNNLSLLQACKLLDLLVALCPDEFQLHQWLYITDTIDAVYQPADWSPVALCDQVAEALGSASIEDSVIPTNSNDAVGSKRRPLLSDNLGVDQEDIKALPREEFIRTVLRPFLSQLSMHAYEGVYSLESPDVARLRSALLADVLDLGSIAE